VALGSSTRVDRGTRRPRGGEETCELPARPDVVRLEAVWPETARRLRSFLHTQGVAPGDCDDITQEVALRVLVSGVTYTDADDLTRWACTVGRRVHLGELRKARALPAGPDVGASMPAPGAVDDAAISRVVLERAVAAMATLTPKDRALLRAAAAGVARPPDGHEARRLAVARYRARLRLAQAIGGLGAAATWAWRRLRWMAPALALGGVGALLLLAPAPKASGNKAVPPAPESRRALQATPHHSTSAVGPVSPTPPTVHPPSPAKPTVRSTVGHRVLLKVGQGPRGVANITTWVGEPGDPLLCTGGLLLLPHVCIG
jgi:DNA-directed RNA polymerase specialized sigma24 family protein